MHIGKLSWVSPKGYGLVKLEGGENAFVPAHIIEEHTEERRKEMTGKRVRVGLSQGSIGKVVTYMHLETEPLFANSGI